MEARSIVLGNQITKIESIHFKDVGTVLMVLPRLNGDQETLEISPQKLI
jgi:type II secretory pathway component GspD/PulD (secretin)